MNNTATGFKSLSSNTTGLGNTASGFESLTSNTEGILNTASGAVSLYSNTSGSQNTASGEASLHFNTTGSDNTASGSGSLYHNYTGSENVAVGSGAGFTNNGSGNVLIGRSSGSGLTSGSYNTATGHESLYYNYTGSNNIAVGHLAGHALTNGDYNIDIGNQGVAYEGNTIRIGDANQSRTFIAGIHGVTPGVSDGLAVIIDSNGQLGTSASVGAVTSVFSRTGAVGATSGDYAASQVTNTPAGGVAATDVQSAINELEAEKAGAVHTHAGTDVTSAVTNATDADTVDGLHASSFVQGETILVVDEDFDGGFLGIQVWNAATTGQGGFDWSEKGYLRMTTMKEGSGAGSATLWSVKQFPLSSGTLIFKAVADSYNDPPAGAVYGDRQPRGLANGTDRSNGIEFISETATSVRCRTVAGGTATETVASIGHTVGPAFTTYQIVASPTIVKFFVDGDLVATHTTNIPTAPLNLYFDTQYSGAAGIFLDLNHVSLERRF